MHNTLVYIMTDPAQRMSIFHGVENEYPEKNVFMCDVIWTMKQVLYDDTNIIQLVTKLRDCTLLQFMKYQCTSPSNQPRTLPDFRGALLKKIRKLKQDQNYITKIKEIKKLRNQYTWEFDKRFKVLMDRFTFYIVDEQHKEWFIAGLLPHKHFPLKKQNTKSQSNA